MWIQEIPPRPPQRAKTELHVGTEEEAASFSNADPEKNTEHVVLLGGGVGLSLFWQIRI